MVVNIMVVLAIQSSQLSAKISKILNSYMF